MIHEMLVRVWRKMSRTPPPDFFPTSLVTAVAEMLPESPVEMAPDYLFSSKFELPANPWRTMLVDHEPEAALLSWVFSAAQLLVIGRGPDESWIVVDLEPDSRDEHRVFEVTADGKTASVLFESLAAFLQWLESPSVPISSTGTRQENSKDVEYALGMLWRLHPATLFGNYCSASWQSEALKVLSFSPPCPGWKRQSLIWTLAHFKKTREVACHPDIAEEDLEPLHVEVMDHLKDLQEAMSAEEVPIIIAELSLEEDDDLATAAMEWMIKFDKAREEAEDPTASELAEKTRGLIRLLQRAIDELIRFDHIEVEPAKKSKLSEELLEAVLKAGSPTLAVPYLIEALLDSQMVEEVYAEDNELASILSKVLGMTV